MTGGEISRFAGTVASSLENNSFISLVFHTPDKANPDAAEQGFLKAKGTVRHIGGRDIIQLETFFTEGRVTQRNVPKDGADRLISEYLSLFMKAELSDRDGTASLYRSKKGKYAFIKNGSPGTKSYQVSEAAGNDQAKKRLLTGEEEFLYQLGVSSRDGRIHDKKQSKFRQICRFSEYIKEAEAKLPSGRELFVYDLCCGKSYLSFAAYHVLTEICGRKVSMFCVDLKKSVIDFCSGVAGRSGMDGLHFICGDILKYEPDTGCDLVISLHACDTATDMVLDFAVRHDAEAILSTPCCHHRMMNELDCPSIGFIAERPILKQKFCDSATDSLRLLKLEAEGYRCDATELIDPEETPKNTMLRAYRRKNTDFSSATQKEKADRYLETYRFLYGKYPEERIFRLYHGA
ncbi:MAG: SAM-dependent methyltransferase [Clostridia bacterium]|nr:SAM-dependent methyltransferase [Clostridia bacterium]